MDSFFSGILNLPKVSTQKLDPALQLNQCGTDRIDVCGWVFNLDDRCDRKNDRKSWEYSWGTFLSWSVLRRYFGWIEWDGDVKPSHFSSFFRHFPYFKVGNVACLGHGRVCVAFTCHFFVGSRQARYLPKALRRLRQFLPQALATPQKSNIDTKDGHILKGEFGYPG